MAKFYSEKEWLSNSQESRNPWSTSSTYIDVGSLGKVIYLAKQTGEIPKVCVSLIRLPISIKLHDITTFCLCIYRHEGKMMK